MLTVFGCERNQHDPAVDDRARDRGSSSLTIVLLTPVFVVVAFMAFQAAMWTNARTEARAAARDAAVLVARFGAQPDDVESSTRAALDGSSSLDVIDVDVPTLQEIGVAGVVSVTVTARANGILLGTSTDVSVTEAVPFEEFRP
jgi:TadE-like protein